MNPQKNGREAWLHSVFQQYEAPLVRYASRLTGDPDRGRDVVQDVFLRLCRNHTEQIADKLTAWLYTVCRNRALDVCKKERPMNPLSAGIESSATAEDPDPALAAEQRETAGQVRSLVNELPPNQQEVLRLKIEHGLKYREISEITGLSVSNVGFLLHTGLQTLKRHYSEQQPT